MRLVLGGLLLLVTTTGGCKQKTIAVVDSREDKTGEYGKQALEQAVSTLRQTPASPQAYRAFALEVEKLRPAFNAPTGDAAERYLAFLSLEPMAAQLAQPVDKQVEVLALTVWPTALHLEPQTNEAPRAYVQRACNGVLAGDCKYVVPEHWGSVLLPLVWRRMKVRAREAYVDCRVCAEHPSYKEILERFDQVDTELGRKRSHVGSRVERSAWPEAGPSAAPWSGVTLLDLVADPPEVGGESVDGDWAARLREVRGTATVLGLHVKPRAEVRLVRAVLRDAAGLGYRAIALQVRQHDFPYALAEYRISTRGGGAAITDSRDIDSVQVLVRGLDAAAGRALAGKPPAAAPLIRLR